MPSLLQKALDNAVDESKMKKDALPINTMTPQEARAEACSRYKANDIENFADLVKSYDLNPNIILENGLTLVQESLMAHPRDAERLKNILMLGANPNLYMTSHDLGDMFGDPSYPKSFHPLNYAFNSSPTTSPEICQILREFGATTQDLVARKEISPSAACQDDLEKATLRKTLTDLTPNPVYVQNIRQDIDTTDRESFLKQQYPAPSPVVEVTPEANDNIPLAHEIGEVVVGQGIYIGLWQPVDNQHVKLNKTYHIYCAPTNLVNSRSEEILTTYDYAISHTGSLTNWHGFDGSSARNENELYKSLTDDTYQGEWFIPPAELIYGVRPLGSTASAVGWVYQQYNLSDCINKPAFKDEFRVKKETYFSQFLSHFRSARLENIVWTFSFDVLSGRQFTVAPRTNDLRESIRNRPLLSTRLFRAVPV